MKIIFGRMVRIGRGTVLLVGLAVILAAVMGVGTTALAAKGKPFILGKSNVAKAITTLVKQGAGPALSLRVQPGQPPLAVNSDGKVANLNADTVDGKDSTQFADGTDGVANNSNRLDGKSAGELVRVASFTGASPLAAGANGTVATTTEIIAPEPGFLVIDASSDVTNFTQSDVVTCFIEVDNGGIAPGSQRYMSVNGASNVNEDEDCSTNTVVPVATGPHTVALEATRVDQPGTDFSTTAISAIYIPFDGEGASPSPGAISAAGEEATLEDGE